MDRPSIAPPETGRSALLSFLPWEAELDRRIARAREQADHRVENAARDAAAIRKAGEERLARLVLESQERARKEAEDRARDRVSDVRARTQRWIEQAEETARAAVEAALDLCCG